MDQYTTDDKESVHRLGGIDGKLHKLFPPQYIVMGTEDRKGEKEAKEIEAIVRFYIIDYLWFTKIHPNRRFLIHKDNLFILTLNS